jgi:membrane-bound lytic murein transglycosylase D
VGTARSILLFLLTPLLALGQQKDQTADLNEVITSAEQWAQENLDEDVLRALQDTDREKVRKFLAELQKEFHGEYVIDLAGLRDTAKTILPVLESYEDTLPYALWLKPRLDYLDVADQFRLILPPPKTEPGQPPKPPPNPSPQKERDIWVTKLSTRPWPEAAKPYISRLKPIFSDEKVPPELVWLAEVESAFDPRARSPAGAAGLFQLMPATAQRFGLRTAWLRDQRYQPEPSARAASKYLHALYTQFKDWRLALAAYNSGEGTVTELMKARKAQTFEQIAPHLPAETQMYVPKVEATLLRREGLKLAQLRVPAGTERR